MNLNTIYQLPAEISERFEEKAAHMKKKPNELILSLVEEFLDASTSDISGNSHPAIQSLENPKELSYRFRLWADSHKQSGAIIPLEAMSRESIYEDRG